MLSRAADSLYWMARYMERAENMARILDVTYRMSLAPNVAEDEERLWDPVVRIACDVPAFLRTYGDRTAGNVAHNIVLNANNSSSILNCIRAARENARAVRGGITSEMWENLNDTWLQAVELDRSSLTKANLSGLCEWVKSRSHLFRGVTYGTILHDEAFRFLRLGSFIERADNTARLLDVKYHVMLPLEHEVGGALDFYEWGAVLRSVSAFESYHKVYRDTITPMRVAELLVLNHAMPRSLHACLDQVSTILDQLAGMRRLESGRLAGELHARLHYGKMEEIFQSGLHEFLESFVERNNQLGGIIQKDFLTTSCA
jgi:uncharacterized alpha-E superfamily protein